MSNALLKWVCKPLLASIPQLSRIEALILTLFAMAIIGTLLQFLFGSLKVTWSVLAGIALVYIHLLLPNKDYEVEAVNDN